MPKDFVRDGYSFRHIDRGFPGTPVVGVYPKGSRNIAWGYVATLYPGSDGKSWAIEIGGPDDDTHRFDARPSFDEACDLAIAEVSK